MNSSSLRRLASDQASLRRSTPPNYLFPPTEDSASLPDDLTQLTVFLTGAQGTAYSQGLWRLHLKMPADYPKNPPKATFKTRIYHPNVEESTGAVCLDTLKKDWESKLTLRDILITVSCLLIHPNPDSALNSAAGALLQEDYEAFARQAKLMTSIHAPIPKDLRNAVIEATRRGEEGSSVSRPDKEDRPVTSRSSSKTSAVIMKKKALPNVEVGARGQHGQSSAQKTFPGEASERDDEEDEAKENDPSQFPTPVLRGPPSPQKNFFGKRPLSELPTPVDPEASDPLDSVIESGMTASEKNISANTNRQISRDASEGPLNKSPKLVDSAQGVNACGRIRQDIDLKIDLENAPTLLADPEAEKENFGNQAREASPRDSVSAQTTQAAPAPPRPSLRKVSNVGSSRGKVPQARVGIRRL